MEAATVFASSRSITHPAIGHSKPVLRDVSVAPTQCGTCAVRKLCMAPGTEQDAIANLERVVATRLRYRKGDSLFRAGDRFKALYSIHSGSCKTVLVTEDGHAQVAGFHLAGDVIGCEGVGGEWHSAEAIALEDTHICVLPFDRVEDLARRDPAFQHQLYRLMSAEIARERRVMQILGTMHADQRLASFLLDLSQRYRVRGYSPNEFILRMTREEIGSYLGLKLETVSRLFSRFAQEGLIDVVGRSVKLRDHLALRQLLELDT